MKPKLKILPSRFTLMQDFGQFSKYYGYVIADKRLNVNWVSTAAEIRSLDLQAQHPPCSCKQLQLQSRMPDSPASLCLMTLQEGRDQQKVLSVVISQCLQEKVLECDRRFLWFSKQQFFQRLHSFKGSQLDTDLLAGKSVYAFYSMLLTCPLYQWEKKKQLTKQQRGEIGWKSEEVLEPWFKERVSYCFYSTMKKSFS